MKHIARFMKDSKVRYKLVLIYACTSFLPILVLTIFCYVQMKRIIIEEEKRNMENYLHQAVSGVDNQIQIYNNLSDYIAFSQSISRVVGSDFQTTYELYSQITTLLDPMLSSLKYFHEHVNRATIYSDKIPARHDSTLAPILEIQDEFWYQEICEGSQRRWYIDMDERTAFTVRRMPMLERNESLGILYIDVDYDHLFETFGQVPGSNYGILVTDRNGEVIYYHTQFEEKYESMALSYEELQEKLGMENSRKTEYSIAYQEAKSGEWCVYLYKPERLIISYIRPMAYLIILTLLLCIVTSAVVTKMTSRFVTEGIEKLTRNMEEVKKGAMEITVTSDAKDEIGDLIRGFGNMLERIKILIDEVYEGKLRQKEYEMKALQAQINPHFLYNTLSLINWKAIAANEADISAITLSLATFYRTALNKGKNLLTVEDELRNMNSYLAIQLVMHDNEFDVELEVEEQILKYETLNLILQPLIENAIGHGIDLKEDGRGRIVIRGRLEGEFDENADGVIVFEVEDNGVGMEKEKAEKILTQQSKGYGVRNVNERIRLYYGEQYHLTIQSVLGEGTMITVRIPAYLPHEESEQTKEG